tara:strand:+ start:4792 stop:6273 length:1482 start_codon:yes stop_codon:yes gene_type:complete
VAIKFDLHISATSAEDLKAQLKRALVELGGAEANPQDVATPNNNAAKAYKREIAEKTKAAMDKKKANLERFTGQVYGWDVDENNSLIPNWDEQLKILMMREMLLHYSYSEVAKEYNRVGFVGKTGGKFTSDAISRIASNKLHERVVEFKGPELTRYLIRKARLEQQEAAVRAKALEQGLIKSPKTKPSKKAEAKARKALNKVKPKKVKPKKVKPKKVKPTIKNPFIKTAKDQAEMSEVVLQKLNRRYTPLNTPFGWRRNSDKYIAPFEPEQMLIARWRNLHYGDKVSFAKIAHIASKSKIPTERKPNGKTRWSKIEIERILTNPINAYYNKIHRNEIASNHWQATEMNTQKKPKKAKKPKKTKKAEKKVAPVHPWKQERLSSEVSFSLWCEEKLIPIIMKEKTFVIGTRLIEAWFKDVKSNYVKSYDQWSTIHQQAIMTYVKKAFNLIRDNASSYVSVQDAGDNCVLMVERPHQLTTEILEKAFEGWTDIGAE